MDTARSFGYLLQHTAFTVGRQADQALQERLGIGVSQFRLLRMLELTPDGSQQRKLANSLGQTEASISRQIKLLAQKGMIATELNPKSRREHIAIPTPKGVKVTQAAQEILQEYYAPLLADFNDKQKQQILDYLGQIHAKICTPTKPFACRRISSGDE